MTVVTGLVGVIVVCCVKYTSEHDAMTDSFTVTVCVSGASCVTVALPLTVTVWGAAAAGVTVTVLYTVTVGSWVACCVTVNVIVVRGDPNGGGHGHHSGSARAKRPKRASDMGATASMASMRRPYMVMVWERVRGDAIPW